MVLTFRGFSTLCLTGLCTALTACSGGGGGGPVPTAPPTAPTPVVPAPTPPPAPTPINYNTAEFQSQPSLAQIAALPAYEDGISGNNVIVAIIDTGIDVDNPEFSGRIHAQSADLVISGIVDPADVRAGGADLEDHDDHGTPVAGIIGAARDDVGVHGVAPEAELLIFRADDDGPDGNVLLGDAIVEGINRSVSNNAEVLNMSFGSDETGARAEFENILSFLKANDIVTALAGGNESNTEPDPSALGALDVIGSSATIIVGAVDANNVIASYSNHAGSAADIFLVAPGNNIRGVVPNAAHGTTASFSGTSASTPHVTGAAVLLRQLWPQLSATDVVEILLDSATDLGAPGTDAIYGRGLLNIGEAVKPLGSVTTTSINGTQTSISDLGGQLTGAFGAGLTKLGDVVVIDGFGRDFKIPLGTAFTQSAPNAFDVEQQYNPFDQYQRTSLPLDGQWKLHLKLSSFDQSTTSLSNNHLAFALNRDQQHDLTDQQLAFAMAGKISAKTSFFAASGFTASTVDRMNIATRRTPFLSATSFSDSFLPTTNGAATAMLRTTLSPRFSVDMLFAHDRDKQYTDQEITDFVSITTPPKSSISVVRAGLNTKIGSATIRLEQGVRQENGTVFNARFGDNTNASILYTAIEGGWAPAKNWYLQGRFASGFTVSSNLGFNSFSDEDPTLTTTQMSFALRKQQLFTASDSLWLGISQPTQIESGTLHLMLPTGFNQQTETFSFTPADISLAAEGRRLDMEAQYRIVTEHFGALDINVIHQTFGQFQTPASTTALIRSSFTF